MEAILIILIVIFDQITKFFAVSQIKGNANKLAFLLKQYGVSERKVEDFSCIEEIAANPIDYNVVNQTILKIRQDSMAYLSNALGELNG